MSSEQRFRLVDAAGEADGPDIRIATWDVVILEPHLPLSKALESELSMTARRSLNVVRSVTNEADFNQAVTDLRPEVGLVSLSLGEDALRSIIEQNRSMVIIVWAPSDGEDADTSAYRAFRCGAHGYYRRDASIRVLNLIIECAMNGMRIVPSPRLEMFFDLFEQHQAAHKILDTITQEERFMWTLVTNGDSDDTIGKKLGLSRATAQRRVEALRTRLGLRDRVQLAALGGVVGLFDDWGTAK